MTDERITARLADVRTQAEDHPLVPSADVLPLLKAVEAVLALVDPPTTVAVTDLDGNWETVRRVVDCGKVRKAISAALLGEEKAGG